MHAQRSPALHLAFDPLFFEHRSRGYHPERPERLEAARRGVSRVEGAGVQVLPLAPRDATDEELRRAHGEVYLSQLARLSGHTAAVDADTYTAPRSIEAARRAAGGAIALAEALVAAGESEPRQGAALLRPPGHHATRDQGMGFCLLNNAALAAYAALAKGLSRVAIVDWDVHHGNGTQDIFWSDDRVFFVSLHEHPLYPGTGAAHEVGEGAGRGFTLNVPLPAASNDAVYRVAFDELVLPALRRFQPELILVSAGFDAHARDPLASMMLVEATYAFMGRALREVADEHAGGRLGVLLEGGYDLTAIEVSLEASLLGALALAGERTPGESVAAELTGELGMRQRDAVEGVKRALAVAYAAAPTPAGAPAPTRA